MEENLTTIRSNDTHDDIALSKIHNLVPGVAALLQLPVILIILTLMVFVYKTYRATFQRLSLSFVILGLWYEFSRALRISLVYSDERWVCRLQKFLRLSSLISYRTYIVVVANFSLLLIPCLMRGRSVSKTIKRVSKYVECICLALLTIIALIG